MLANLAIPLQLVCQLIVPGSDGSANSTLDLDVQLPIPHEPATLPNGYHAFPDIGVAYKYYNHSRTWNMARKTCIAHDSTLAVIDSFKKSGYVDSIRENDEWGVFVGIHRLFGNSEWVSVNDGLPVGAIPWAPSTGEEDDKSNCLSLWNDGRGVAAIPCEEIRNFVCEIRLPMDSRISTVATLKTN